MVEDGRVNNSAPSHEPTKEQRKIVEAMSSYGTPQEGIASVIGIDVKTLRKHYREELDTATAKANAQVAQRLYRKCLAGDTTSMIFWMKTRGRWSEKVEHALSGADGGPIEIVRRIIHAPKDGIED